LTAARRGWWDRGVPEYDAFGRPVGEDTLAAMGWTSSLGQPAPARPAPQAPPEAKPTAATPAPAPARTPRRRRGGLRFLRSVLSLAILGGIGLGVVSAAKTGSDAVRGVVDDIKVTVPTVAPDQPAPKATRARSLTTPRGLKAGLRLLRRDVPGQVRTFRLEASRIDVTVWRKGGRLRTAQLQAGAAAAQVFSTTPGGFPRGGTFSYRAVDPKAPARLIRAADRRLGKRASQVNYLVLTNFGTQLTWGVYFKDGAIAQGDRRGRFLRKLSG
jgi:hypothetical protein